MDFRIFLSPSLLLFILSLAHIFHLSLQLPRWLGGQKIHESTLRLEQNSSGVDPTRVIQLSWIPRIFLHKEFLSEEECDHLINLARGKLKRSLGVNGITGLIQRSKHRTSLGTSLQHRQDEIVASIQERIAAWTLLPEENGESLQILRYENGEKYDPHVDYFNGTWKDLRGGERFATVLIYLSNVEKGGETIFTEAEVIQEKDDDDTWSDCAKYGYAVKPKKGDALLFFNLHSNTTIDKNSIHGSCPVIKGVKWSATRWIHIRHRNRISSQHDVANFDEGN